MRQRFPFVLALTVLVSALALPAPALARMCPASGSCVTIVTLTGNPDVLLIDPDHQVAVHARGSTDVVASSDAAQGGDSINGDGGRDVLYGGRYAQELDGGPGNDVIVTGPLTDKAADTVDCGDGSDDIAWVGPNDTTTNCEHVKRLAADKIDQLSAQMKAVSDLLAAQDAAVTKIISDIK